MTEEWKTYHCPRRYPNTGYDLYAYEIDPTPAGADKEFVDLTRDGEACQLALRMNPNNTDGKERTWEERLKDAYLGVLAEKLIVKYLRAEFGQEANIVSESYTKYDEHVDIKINWNNGDSTTIEVRSSFGA